MATTLVGYFVKGTKPTNPTTLHALKVLAYRAAKAVDPSVTEVLIR